jgi:hypothetical protein
MSEIRTRCTICNQESIAEVEEGYEQEYIALIKKRGCSNVRCLGKIEIIGCE